MDEATIKDKLTQITESLRLTVNDLVSLERCNYRDPAHLADAMEHSIGDIFHMFDVDEEILIETPEYRVYLFLQRSAWIDDFLALRQQKSLDEVKLDVMQLMSLFRNAARGEEVGDGGLRFLLGFYRSLHRTALGYLDWLENCDMYVEEIIKSYEEKPLLVLVEILSPVKRRYTPSNGKGEKLLVKEDQVNVARLAGEIEADVVNSFNGVFEVENSDPTAWNALEDNIFTSLVSYFGFSRIHLWFERTGVSKSA